MAGGISQCVEQHLQDMVALYLLLITNFLYTWW